MPIRSSKKLKVALVHDWLTDFGGAERVLLAFRELWPDAPIYTTLYRPDRVPQFADADIRTSYLQRIPFARDRHRLLAPFMPTAVEAFDFDEFDIVISSTSSGAAKGIITGTRTLHISYCHNPPRYLWDGAHEYIRLHGSVGQTKLNPLLRLLMPGQLRKLRIWDRCAADRVDEFVTNSQFVAQRIEKYYQRNATVIYPPVETARFEPAKKVGNYYLAVGRLIPYKRFDLAVQAANILGVKLRIVGTGSELEKLKSIAGPTVQFLGAVSDEQLRRMYGECKALIFPQVEDFGLTAVEVQAAGRPVIAYRAGGALETVVPNRTGILFAEQTPASLADAIQKFESKKFTSSVIRKHAERFDIESFKKKFFEFTMQRFDEFNR